MILKFGFATNLGTIMTFFFYLCCFEILSSCLAQTDFIEEIRDSPGIYFKHLGSVFDYVNDNNLIVAIDLRPIRELIDDLEKLRNLIVEFSSPPDRSSQILSQFDLHMEKIKTNFQTLRLTVDKNRIRRDSPDQDHLNDPKKSNNQLKNMTARAFEATSSKWEANLQRLRETLRNVDSFVRQANIRFIFDKFFQVQQQVDAHMSELQLAVILAKRNIIHPSVLTPSRLLEFFDSNVYFANFQYPFQKNLESMARYLDICTVSTSFVEEKLQFTITLPKLYGTGYDLYSLLKFPKATENSDFIFIEPTNNFLIVNITESRYTYLNTLENCKQIEKALWICSPLILNLNLSTQCETSILAKLPHRCIFEKYNGTPYIQYSLDDYQWAFAGPKRRNYFIPSKNGTIVRQLPANGILKYKSLCASTETHSYYGGYCRSNNHQIEQSISISKFMSTMASSILPDNLSWQVRQNFDLKSFEDVIDQLNRKVETMQQSFNDAVNRQASESMKLQVALDQLKQLETLQHSIDTIINEQVSQNASFNMLANHQKSDSTKLQDTRSQLNHQIDATKEYQISMNNAIETIVNRQTSDSMKLQAALNQLKQFEILQRSIDTIIKEQRSQNASFDMLANRQMSVSTKLEDTLNQLEHKVDTIKEHQRSMNNTIETIVKGQKLSTGNWFSSLIESVSSFISPQTSKNTSQINV